MLRIKDYYFKVVDDELLCLPVENENGDYDWAEVEYLPHDMAKIVNDFFNTTFDGDD